MITAMSPAGHRRFFWNAIHRTSAFTGIKNASSYIAMLWQRMNLSP